MQSSFCVLTLYCYSGHIGSGTETGNGRRASDQLPVVRRARPEVAAAPFGRVPGDPQSADSADEGGVGEFEVGADVTRVDGDGDVRRGVTSEGDAAQRTRFTFAERKTARWR